MGSPGPRDRDGPPDRGGPGGRSPDAGRPRPGRRDGRYSFGTWSQYLGHRQYSKGIAVLAAFLLGIVGFAVGFGLLAALGAVIPPDVSLSPTTTIVLGLIVLQGIAFPVTAIGYVKFRGLSLSFLRVRRPSLYDVLIAFGGFVVAIGLVFSALVVITAVGAETAQRSDQELLMNPDVLQILIPASLLLIGPGEELLFRGAIQTTLREAFGAPAAILLASAAFAPAHIVALTGSIQGLAVSIGVLFLPSLVFGAVYEYTENLVVPALSHGLYNALLFSLALVATTAGESGALLL